MIELANAFFAGVAITLTLEAIVVIVLLLATAFGYAKYTFNLVRIALTIPPAMAAWYFIFTLIHLSTLPNGY